MRFNLTNASYRVLDRAARLRLQTGISAISAAKVLWAIFEEEECRAAHWLTEAGLSLNQFKTAFGIQTLQSPISAPAFPAGSYGISAGQYTPPAAAPPGIESAPARNNAPPVGNPYPDQPPPNEEEHETAEQYAEPEPDDWKPSELSKYSLYQQPTGNRPAGQSRLQFYLDDQWINAGLFVPELENTLEMIALRLGRNENLRESISVSNGMMRITNGAPAFSLATEHLLLAAVLDNSDIGRWLQEKGFDPAELYQRIGNLTATNESPNNTELIQNVLEEEVGVSEAVTKTDLPQSFYRLLDAAANRGREAIRVIEDYVRFVLDDAELTQRLKTFRHEFQFVLQQFPIADRLAARDTEQDVGTELTASGEYLRSTLEEILSANFSRLQEALRSLEEFSKLFDPNTARQFEQLRYQCYTVHKVVGSGK